MPPLRRRQPAENAKDLRSRHSGPAACGGRGGSAAGPYRHRSKNWPDEFKDLEGVLMRMRDLDPPHRSQPRRSDRKGPQGKRRPPRRGRLPGDLDLLRQDQLGNAARKQGKVNEDLEAILQLLLSEDSSKRLKDRQAEFRKYLEQLNIIIRDQGDVHGRTLSAARIPSRFPSAQQALPSVPADCQKISTSEEKDRGNAKDNSKDDPKGIRK